MTPNQRLIVAVVLSVVFFIIYTAIFPPKKPVANDTKNTVTSTSQQKTGKQETKNIEDIVGHKVSEADRAVVGSSSDILTVQNKNFILKMDTLGRISSKVLLETKFNDKDGNQQQLVSLTKTKPLFIRFLDESLNKEALKVPYVSSVKNVTLQGKPQKVVLTQKLSKLTVTKELTFYPDGHYDVKISLSKDKRYFIYLGQHPKSSKRTIAAAGAMIYTQDGVAHIIENGDAEGRQIFSGVEFISSFNQYTATILYGFPKNTNIIVEADRDEDPVVYFDGLQTMQFNGYIGEKNFELLKSIKPILTNAIEYGWFTFVSKPLFAFLSWLHGIFGNWGWAIIALTLIVRVVLYPLTYKGMMSMQRMKEIAPKVKELQAKYKGDPQRMNAAVMDLYKKHNANPLGGCLPMILQIPIFFAIYRVLLNAVELQGAPWILWIDNLAQMDPYYVLPILMGGSMFLQQRMSPNNITDPMQEKIFKYLPVVFTFFFMTFPAGLVLYWVVNNLFSILQQFIVNQQFQNKKDLEQALAKKDKK